MKHFSHSLHVYAMAFRIKTWNYLQLEGFHLVWLANKNPAPAWCSQIFSELENKGLQQTFPFLNFPIHSNFNFWRSCFGGWKITFWKKISHQHVSQDLIFTLYFNSLWLNSLPLADSGHFPAAVADNIKYKLVLSPIQEKRNLIGSQPLALSDPLHATVRTTFPCSLAGFCARLPLPFSSNSSNWTQSAIILFVIRDKNRTASFRTHAPEELRLHSSYRHIFVSKLPESHVAVVAARGEKSGQLRVPSHAVDVLRVRAAHGRDAGELGLMYVRITRLFENSDGVVTRPRRYQSRQVAPASQKPTCVRPESAELGNVDADKYTKDAKTASPVHVVDTSAVEARESAHAFPRRTVALCCNTWRISRTRVRTGEVTSMPSQVNTEDTDTLRISRQIFLPNLHSFVIAAWHQPRTSLVERYAPHGGLVRCCRRSVLLCRSDCHSGASVSRSLMRVHTKVDDTNWEWQNRSSHRLLPWTTSQCHHSYTKPESETQWVAL